MLSFNFFFVASSVFFFSRLERIPTPRREGPHSSSAIHLNPSQPLPLRPASTTRYRPLRTSPPPPARLPGAMFRKRRQLPPPARLPSWPKSKQLPRLAATGPRLGRRKSARKPARRLLPRGPPQMKLAERLRRRRKQGLVKLLSRLQRIGRQERRRRRRQSYRSEGRKRRSGRPRSRRGRPI